MLDGLDGNAVPGVAIALLALIGVLYQARVGVRPAEREGFRADFREFVDELKKDNDKLETKIVSLEAKIEEQTIELQALGGYTRDLVGELRRHNLPVPGYSPPPDLSKHLR